MSSSLRRHRFRVRVPDEDPIADVEIGSRSSTESSTDPGEYEADLESMTGKGIKRLCSELIELKKTSDEDFQRNVYSNHSAFVRIFEEIGGLESDIMELKKHASTQVKLVQALMSNFYADMVTDGLKETKVEDLGLSSPSWFGIHMQDVLVTLDILLSECRLKEALTVLEKETLTLQKLQIEEDRSSPIIMSYAYAISERRSRLADQLASMAEHPRLSQPELQKTLFGLCRLGENHRANSLLLKFYRSLLQKRVHELQCSKPCPYGTHIRDRAKVVFSAISQAATCFAVLYGETSPYCSELILWAREETEAFTHDFSTYVRSISERNGGLSLAIEAVNSAISLCSLLECQRIFLLSNLMEMIKPCMEEVLQMHVDHFRKVVPIFTTTDNWTLGKFLSLGILRDKSSVAGIGDKVEYCLLTSSGRKFVTLMQAIVDDISPLVNLRMGSSILKGLGDLFSEYMWSLERAIPTGGNAIENASPKVSSAQTFMQQLSLLANASTLVHFLPSIAGSIFRGSSNDDLLPKQTEKFLRNDLDDWILSIEEAADQLKFYFCQQFVFGVMSHGDFESVTYLDNLFTPSSSQDSVPSLAFQALFVRLRQLEQLSKSIIVGDDGMMNKLPKEILETVIIWLSNNLELWTVTVKQSCIRHCSCLEQVYLDMHFLVEIAVLGGYCSDDLIVAAMDLIEEMEAAFTKTGSGPNGIVPDGDWALNAAKSAIEKLLEVEVANSEPKVELADTSLRDSRTESWEDNCPSEADDLMDTAECSTLLLDGESENLVDDDATRLSEIKDIVHKSFGGQMSDVISDLYDDDGSRSPTVPYSDREDGEDADRANIGTDGPSESEDIGELELQRLCIKAEVQAVGNLDDFDALVAQAIVEETQVTFGKENVVLENEPENSMVRVSESQAILEEPEVTLGKENVVLENELENSMLRVPEGIDGLEAEVPTTNPEEESIGSLGEFNAVVTKLTTAVQQDISRKATLAMEAGLLDVGRLKEIDGTQELVDVEHTAFPEMEFVGNFQQFGTVSSRPVTVELLDIAHKEKLLLETELLHTEGLREVKSRKGREMGVHTRYPEIDKLDGCDAIAAQAGIHEPDYGKGNLLVETELIKAAYNLDISVFHDSNSRVSAEVDNNPSDAVRLDLEGEKILLEDSDNSFTMSEELVQVGSSKVKDKPAVLELHTIEDRDRLLSDNFSELVLETSLQNHGGDGGIPPEGSGKASGGSARERVAKQYKTLVLSSERNVKVFNALGSKTSSEVNTPPDVLVKSSRLDPMRKTVKLESHSRHLAALGEFVQVDRSEPESEPAILEPQIIGYGDRQLSDNFSELVPLTSPQNRGDGVALVEGTGNTSTGSAGRKGLKKQFRSAVPSLERSIKSSNGSDSKTSFEVNDTYEVLIRPTGLDLEKEFFKLEGNARPEELDQVDRSELEGEAAILDPQDIEVRNKMPSENFSQLVPATTSRERGQDGVRHVEVSGKNTSSASVRQKAVIKKRSRTVAPSWSGSNGSDLKIFSDVNNPSDVLVKPIALDLEKKLVMLEGSTSPSIMLKELVQVDGSEVEGEPALFEPQTFMSDIELLHRNSSDLVVGRDRQGIDIVGRVEVSRSISSNSLPHIGGREHSQAASAAEVTEKGLDGLSAKQFSEVKNPFDAFQENVVLLEAGGSLLTKSEEDVQVVGSLVKDETATREPLKTEEEEELLSSKFSELALETSLRKQGSDSSNPFGSSGNTSGDREQQRGGRKRSKSSAEENLVKSGKGAKALRPRWH